MIDWFVVYALGKRLVVATICVFVSIYGFYSWTQLAIEAQCVEF
jgi:Cu/Ag efflux pump CusA